MRRARCTATLRPRYSDSPRPWSGATGSGSGTSGRASEFNARGIPAATVVGDTPREERARIYAGLASGDIKVCSGVMVTTEGWDAPAVSCILQCRPTRLPGLYCFDRQTELLTRDGWQPG